MMYVHVFEVTHALIMFFHPDLWDSFGMRKQSTYILCKKYRDSKSDAGFVRDCVRVQFNYSI